MNKLTVSKESFSTMLLGIIQSGVTFHARENSDGDIVVTFTGGF